MGRTLLGVDLGAASLRLVEVAKAGTSYSVVNVIELALPPEAYRDGQIVDALAVGQLLKEAVKTRLKPRTRQAALSIAGNIALVRRVSLPKMRPRRLRALLETQGDQWIPFLREGAVFDQIVVNPALGEKVQEVLLVGLPLRQLTLMRRALKIAGLSLAGLDVDVMAVYRAALAQGGKPGSGAVAVLHMEAGRARLGVLTDGHLLAVKSLDAPLANTEPFLADVRRSLETMLFRRHEELRLTGLIVSGEDGLSGETAAAIERELRGTMGHYLDETFHLLSPTASQSLTAEAVGLGLALLRAVAPKGMNLLPRPTVAERQQTGLSLVLTALLLLGTAIYGYSWNNEMPRLAKRQAQLNGQLEQLSGALAQEPAIAAMEARIKRLTPLVTELNRHDPWFHVAPALKALLPPGTSLTNVKADPPNLTIAGTAQSPELVGHFVQALDDSARFAGPMLTSTGAGKGPVSFTVVVEMAPREVKN